MKRPTIPAVTIVNATDTRNGSFSDSEKNHIIRPPITTNSPWARFMIEVALYVILKPMPTKA
jgi:hypothetical protein